MTISILGAGWLGLPLGARLAAEGNLVYGSSTSPERLAGLSAAGIAPFLLDIGSDNWQPGHDFWRSEVLVVTIPPSSTVKGGRHSTSDPGPEYRDRIARAVQLAVDNGMRRCIYTSSTSVYGGLEGDVDEEMAPAPVTTSAKMVRSVEEMLFEELGDRGMVLRLGGLVGRDREPTRFLAGRSGISNPDSPTNMVHREDLLRIIPLLLKEEEPRRIYNVVADGHPSRKDYHQARARRLGLDIPQFAAQVEVASTRRILNHRIKSDLGYAFLHPDPILFP